MWVRGERDGAYLGQDVRLREAEPQLPLKQLRRGGGEEVRNAGVYVGELPVMRVHRTCSSRRKWSLGHVASHTRLICAGAGEGKGKREGKVKVRECRPVCAGIERACLPWQGPARGVGVHWRAGCVSSK